LEIPVLQLVHFNFVTSRTCARNRRGEMADPGEEAQVQAQQLGAVQAQQLGDSLHVELQQLRGKAEKAEAKVEAAQEEVDQLKAEIAALVAQRKEGGPPDAELEATIVRKEASRDIANQALTATTNRLREIEGDIRELRKQQAGLHGAAGGGGAGGTNVTQGGDGIAGDATVRSLEHKFKQLELRSHEERAKREELERRSEEERARREELERRSEQQIAALEERLDASRYTTQNEHDIGDLLLTDLQAGRIQPLVFAPPPSTLCMHDLPETLLTPIGDEPEHEDCKVNGPIAKLLRETMPMKFQINLCTTSSPLIDARGREHRADLVVLRRDDPLAWPNVITVGEGKLRLSTDAHKEALGQAQRRAAAILEQQPWRQSVVIFYFSIEKVGFLRLERHRKPTVSDLYDFVAAQDGKLVLKEGFLLLHHLLTNNTGFVQCPVHVDTESVLRHVTTVKHIGVICARSHDKAVFRVEENDGTSHILKVFSHPNIADHERAVMGKLKGLQGVLSCSDVFPVTTQVEHGDVGGHARSEWFGVLMPECRGLTPGEASPQHFAAYAKVLSAAAGCGIHHNDLSLDNLMLNGDAPCIIDWEHATMGEHHVMGFRGKLLFASEAAFAEKHEASLRLDLESLFYVAVCCALRDLPWGRQSDKDAMRRERQRSCGLTTTSARTFCHDLDDDQGSVWGQYLRVIATSLREGADAAPVLESFCNAP